MTPREEYNKLVSFAIRNSWLEYSILDEYDFSIDFPNGYSFAAVLKQDGIFVETYVDNQERVENIMELPNLINRNSGVVDLEIAISTLALLAYKSTTE